ncbi:MAG: hypothetical protein U0L54_08510 [Bacteroidales bacterium]|nr:hypothetical protein [Bacteroidales bacterium]
MRHYNQLPKKSLREVDGKVEGSVIVDGDSVVNIQEIVDVSRKGSQWMPATPSGDPMHMAYVAAGAVWDKATKTWSANGKSGLSNSEIRSLYNKSDMEELLFRKLWNAVGNNITNEQCKPRYDEETGFYRANGIWHIGYEEALNIYANNTSLCNGDMKVSSTALISNQTTLPCMSGDFIYNYNFVWLKNLVDIRLCYHEGNNAYEHARSFATASTSSFKISYCYNLRIIRDCIYSIVSSVMANFDRVDSLIHVPIYFANKASRIENLSQCPNLSYFSLYTMLNKTKENQLQGLKLHEDVYNLIVGNMVSEELSMEPITPKLAMYKMIPYQRNLKIIPENALWREEFDIKGINGEYIYPSFAEYLAEHPADFATSEDWQALAILAQEKGITLTV